MACSTIHLAVAKQYLEKHQQFNYEKVIAGTLSPDASSNNDLSHNEQIIAHYILEHPHQVLEMNTKQLKEACFVSTGFAIVSTCSSFLISVNL